MQDRFFTRMATKLPHTYREIGTHFSYVFALQITQQVIGFVSFFFIVHYVPKEIIGHYHFVLSVIALVSITALPGMRAALMQSIARGYGGFFKTATKYSVLGAGVGSVMLGGIGGYFLLFKDDPIMAAAFGVAALFNPLSQGLMIWKSSYTGAERFKALSLIDASATLATSLFLIASVFVHTETPVLLLSIAVIIPALQNLIMWCIEYGKYREATTAEDRMQEYGLKTSGYDVLTTVAGQVDRLAIYNFMSAGDLAVYNVAMKIPEAIKNVFQNIGFVIMPKFSRMKVFTDGLDRKLKWLSFFSLIAIVAVTFTIFPWIYLLIVPESYAYSLVYAQALLISVGIGNHAVFRAKYIRSQKDPESYRALVLGGTVIKIVSAPLLVYAMGVWGAVIAIFIQRVFMSGFTEYLIRKKFKG